MYYGPISRFQKHGQGYYFFEDGSKYVGEFKQGKITGKGSFFNRRGSEIGEGFWKSGVLINSKHELNSIWI